MGIWAAVTVDTDVVNKRRVRSRATKEAEEVTKGSGRQVQQLIPGKRGSYNVVNATPSYAAPRILGASPQIMCDRQTEATMGSLP
jgi:hypothetical protein